MKEFRLPNIPQAYEVPSVVIKQGAVFPTGARGITVKIELRLLVMTFVVSLKTISHFCVLGKTESRSFSLTQYRGIICFLGSCHSEISIRGAKAFVPKRFSGGMLSVVCFQRYKPVIILVEKLGFIQRKVFFLTHAVYVPI